MTEENLAQLGERLQNLEKRVGSLEGVLSSRQEIAKGQIQSKSLSLSEFMAEKNPINDVQITLAIGYYLEHNKNIATFNINDIESEFRSAKMPPPSNINDKINMNIRKKPGFIMESPEKKDGKKAWTLTASGEKEVEKGFGK